MGMASMWVLTMPNGIPKLEFMFELEEFELNVPQACREVEKDFLQKFRSSKYAFRKEILRKCKSVEEAIAACPDGKDLNHWAAFVRNESTVEDKEDPSRKHGRVDSWKKGHERRDGTILASTQTYYEQVEASNKRRKEASAGGEGSVMEVDFDNDELFEVFGPDKGSRTRGISSNKSKKQLQCTVCSVCTELQIDTPMLASELNILGALSHFTVIRNLEGGIFPMGFTKEVTDRNSKAGLNILGVESR
ncbi:hypothetical protein IFM89_019872 [Coptis chinensis]|uniref:Uncharacterized protein n=1 Tax=Coptis chinensis TaxID=261450 RepID=A0A835MIP4_9MAGN|nr:hypothetical protein IFM89_019872 [Coptis chinensis]